ncbi:MAG: hypothetical protein A2Y25_05625 [Candidatus Melainabacteria bacterium GWF2_37_15]|nr:MAG: hypothetical protein A2Y25_05625 [Candidatus Melainabacteria bacterium GWF2_37_15]
MEISGVDIILSRMREIETRVSQIERGFDSLLGVDNKDTQSFDSVLNEKMQDNNQTNDNDINLPELDQIIEKYSDKNDLDENLVKAVIKAESNYNKNAVSPVGAQGLMQLMPSTAKSLGVENAFDPEQNISGGTKYLKNLINKYNSVELGLAAYNAGPGSVNKYGGIPPYQETRNYVKKVLEIQKGL